MKNRITAKRLLEFIKSGQKHKIIYFCKSSHPAKIAEILSGLSLEDIRAVLELVGPALRSEIFA